MKDVRTLTGRLREIGREFHARGWSRGTSSNYSVVTSRDPLELVITASGLDKSALGDNDFVRVDRDGHVIDGSGRHSSAETLLHCLIAETIPSVGAVLHTHSVWATILSRKHLSAGMLRIGGYEMLKGLEGIKTHDTFEDVPIFENSQDMRHLSDRVLRRIETAGFDSGPRHPFHGFLLAGHGLYTWGSTLEEARRHVEIYEFLFEVVRRSETI